MYTGIDHMDFFDVKNEQQSEQGARRPYETPRLTAHGTLAQITQAIGKNSGVGDVDNQSGGAG
jgi:hypothetical protein